MNVALKIILMSADYPTILVGVVTVDFYKILIFGNYMTLILNLILPCIIDSLAYTVLFILFELCEKFLFQ